MTTAVPTMVVLALRMASPDVPAPQPATDTPARSEAPDTRATYLQVGLGGGAVWPHRASYGPPGPGLTFALEAGALRPGKGRRQVAIGGAIAQTGHGAAVTGWPSGSATDLLAKVRLGARWSRGWGYGIGGLGLSFATFDCGACLALTSGPVASVGAGIRFALRHNISLGFETEGSAMWRPTRNMLARLSASVVLVVRFGRATGEREAP